MSKRKVETLPLKSIWEPSLVAQIVPSAKHRAKLWNWLIRHPEVQDLNAIPFEEWLFPRESYQILRKEFLLFTTKIVEKKESVRGDTTKLLVELQDGHRVETVVMRHMKHSTTCVSSQIGCQMGCRFCATGTMGIIGDLTAGEILEQLVHANMITRIRNVVFMGMGEPLQNYDNVKSALEFMIDEKRFALSPRHVTVSTVGVLKNMRRLSDEMPQVNLALSLHAPNQEVRLKIVPTASANKMEQLMDAIDYHVKRYVESASEGRKKRNANSDNGSVDANKGDNDDAVAQDMIACVDVNEFSVKSNANDVENAVDNSNDSNINNNEVNEVNDNDNENENNDNEHDVRVHGYRPSKTTGVMIEYILIRDINDRPEHAHELGRLLSKRRGHILLNLIPYNPTEVAEDYLPPTPESVQQFFEICRSKPYLIFTRIRQEMGQDIAGACGQLALVNAPENVNKDIEDYVNKKKNKVKAKSIPGNNKANNHSNNNNNAKTCQTPNDCENGCKKDALATSSKVGRLQTRNIILALSLPILALALQFVKSKI